MDKNSFIIGSLGGMFLNEFRINSSQTVLTWSKNPMDSCVFKSFHDAEATKDKIPNHPDLVVLTATVKNGCLDLKACISSALWI